MENNFKSETPLNLMLWLRCEVRWLQFCNIVCISEIYLQSFVINEEDDSLALHNHHFNKAADRYEMIKYDDNTPARIH